MCAKKLAGSGNHSGEQTGEEAFDVDNVFVSVAYVNFLFSARQSFQNLGRTLLHGHSASLSGIHLCVWAAVAAKRVQADIGADVSGTDQQYFDSRITDFGPQGVEETVQSMFGGGIAGAQRRPKLSHQAGNDDNMPTFLFGH